MPAVRKTSLAAPNRHGLWYFLVRNSSISSAFILGIGCVIASFYFTFWLSKQRVSCPAWTVGCEVRPTIRWMVAHIGLIQGLVTTVNGIGLSSMVYASQAFGEADFWPILRRQSFTLRKFDGYLSAVRGSLLSLFQALLGNRNRQVAITLTPLLVLALTVLSGLIIVGFVFTPQNVTNEYKSSYNVGGGLGLPFTQYNPPGPLPEAIAAALSEYASWASGLAVEPMPNQRDFIMDRANLSRIGDMSIYALKAEKTINCSGRSITLIGDVQGDSLGTYYLDVATNINGMIGGQNLVSIRLQPRMVLWIDRVEYISSTRTISTLVFAALNGTIENGILTKPTDTMASMDYNGISAVACTVDVQLKNDQFVIGNGASSFATVSSLATVTGPRSGPNQSPYGSHGDLAVWLGTTVAAYGISIFLVNSIAKAGEFRHNFAAFRKE